MGIYKRADLSIDSGGREVPVDVDNAVTCQIETITKRSWERIPKAHLISRTFGVWVINSVME